MLRPLLGLQILFNRQVQRLAKVWSRSEHCFRQHNIRIQLFLSRTTDYTLIHPGQTQFSRLTTRGHLCVAEAEVTAKISVEIRGKISLLLVITATTATPSRSCTYVPRHYDDRRPFGDERNPGFDARNVLAQRRIDRGKAHRDGYDRDHQNGSGAVVPDPECFSRAIQSAEIPPNFRLAAGISKFTSESKPETWLDDCRVAVQIGGGNDNVAMKHLSLMLDGLARAWLNQLAPSSIYCREDLARLFIRTFEGTCKRPAGLSELQHCVQKQNETLRDYIQHWTTLHHTVKNVSEHQAVCVFKAGVRYRELYLKFGRTRDMSLSKMMEIAT